MKDRILLINFNRLLQRAALQDGSVYSYPCHVHASRDKFASNKHLKRDPKRDTSVTFREPIVSMAPQVLHASGLRKGWLSLVREKTNLRFTCPPLSVEFDRQHYPKRAQWRRLTPVLKILDEAGGAIQPEKKLAAYTGVAFCSGPHTATGI